LYPGHSVFLDNAAGLASAQWQIQRHGTGCAISEAVLTIKPGSAFIQRVHQQSVDSKFLAQFEATRYRVLKQCLA
jgi:hypothetical protein